MNQTIISLSGRECIQDYYPVDNTSPDGFMINKQITKQSYGSISPLVFRMSATFTKILLSLKSIKV